MATRIDDLSKPLASLVKLLRKGGGTAEVLASKMKCSKPTIYARVASLRDVHGYAVKVSTVRQGAKGPEATAWALRAA